VSTQSVIPQKVSHQASRSQKRGTDSENETDLRFEKWPRLRHAVADIQETEDITMADNVEDDHDGISDEQCASHQCNHVVIELVKHPRQSDIGTDVSNTTRQTSFDDLNWRTSESQEEKAGQLRRWSKESQVEAQADEAQRVEERAERVERKREKARECQQRYRE
jgi:hypothetical protein